MAVYTVHQPPLGKGEIGRKGLRAFLAEPHWDGVPVVLEGPGIDGHNVARKDVELARRLRREGVKARG